MSDRVSIVVKKHYFMFKELKRKSGYFVVMKGDMSLCLR